MGIMIKRKVSTEVPVVPADKSLKPVLKQYNDKERQQAKESISRLHEKYYGNGSANKKEKQEAKVKQKVGAIKKEKEAKKEAVKKSKGETIDDIWHRILAAAVGKKKTDKDIAAEMNVAVDKAGHKHAKYGEAQVAAHRSGYNCGKFPIQKGIKPKVRLEKYEK